LFFIVLRVYFFFGKCKSLTFPPLSCLSLSPLPHSSRVLLERLIVHRPHPWGLLITFIELIKNPRYTFWQQPFTRCAPEIERLFDSVARSCMPAPVAQGAPSAQGAQAPKVVNAPGGPEGNTDGQ
jgi:hypothetical protein